MRIDAWWGGSVAWKCESCKTITERIIIDCSHGYNIAVDDCPYCTLLYRNRDDSRTDEELR